MSKDEPIESLATIPPGPWDTEHPGNTHDREEVRKLHGRVRMRELDGWQMIAIGLFAVWEVVIIGLLLIAAIGGYP